ncbi:hypothetical protein [Microbacterium sp. NPDC057650]|uniref:hypothetical protein n=1 Tax=unclassified Microbacterium TaxID=2609290 RepID=UPI003672946F
MTTAFVFIAAGDACPLCEGLHGEKVEPGFKPHDNCNCNTVQDSNGDPCQFVANDLGSMEMQDSFQVQLRLTVQCKDRSTRTKDIQYRVVKGDPPRADDVEEDLSDLCDECAPGADDGDDDFLCC